MPVDLILGELNEHQPIERVDDYVAETRERQLNNFALVREHLGQAATRRKDRYDDRVNARTFHVGQLVWYLYIQR